MSAPVVSGSARFDASGTTADRLLTADEVAAMLSVPTRWVREHTRSGFLPHVSLGRYVRYRRTSLLAWVEAQEAGGAAWQKHRPVPGSGTK